MSEREIRPSPIVTPDQIAAANAIHDHHMPGWRKSDEAIDSLAAFLPEWDEDSVLAKAAVVNQLYNARHDRLLEVRDAICLAMKSPHDDPVALVNAIAPVDHGEGTWECVSFASKFVHFFVHPDRAPIYDGWAVEALRHHFGRLRWKGHSPYGAFAEYVHAVLATLEPRCSLRELDRYLWLSGMYRKAKGKDNEEVRWLGIGEEVRRLFLSRDRRAQELLGKLVLEAPSA